MFGLKVIKVPTNLSSIIDHADVITRPRGGSSLCACLSFVPLAPADPKTWLSSMPLWLYQGLLGFILSFNRYLINTIYVPDTVIGPMAYWWTKWIIILTLETLMWVKRNSQWANKTQSMSHRVWYLGWRKIKQERKGRSPGCGGSWGFILVLRQGLTEKVTCEQSSEIHRGGLCRHHISNVNHLLTTAFKKQHHEVLISTEHMVCAQHVLCVSWLHRHIPVGYRY